MREAALVPLPAIAGSEEAAPGDSGLLAREVVASAVGVAVARLGVVRLAAGLVVAVLGVGAAAVGRPLVARARLGGEVLEVCSLDQPTAAILNEHEVILRLPPGGVQVNSRKFLLMSVTCLWSALPTATNVGGPTRCAPSTIVLSGPSPTCE